MQTGNLFTDIPARLPAEHITELLAASSLKIERIVSKGHASPEGFWYDQDRAEWVIVLQGSARLSLEGEAVPRTLNAGDYLDIPAHVRHRVEWTSTEPVTLWLAVHYR